MATLPYEPKVGNRYNLTYATAQNLKIGKRELISEELFYRNDQIAAWCIYKESDLRWGEDSFWLGIYDEDAPVYPGEFRFRFTSYGGMCGYVFEEFYNPNEIQNKFDLMIQEKFLNTINQLLDLGILVQA